MDQAAGHILHRDFKAIRPSPRSHSEQGRIKGCTWTGYENFKFILETQHMTWKGVLQQETQGPPRAFSAGNSTTNPTGSPNTVGSNGPVPEGTFPIQNPVHTEGRPEYGPYFFPVGEVGSNGERLDIARQRGIGIHGGRRGPESRTQGCIRVSDETDRNLNQIHQADPIHSITIRESRNE